MTARMISREIEKQLISRFIGGLRNQLQIALAQFNPMSVSEAHQRAISMELQLRPPWTSTRRSRPQHSSPNDNSGQGVNLQQRVLRRKLMLRNYPTMQKLLLTLGQLAPTLYIATHVENEAISKRPVRNKRIEDSSSKMQTTMNHVMMMTGKKVMT